MIKSQKLRISGLIAAPTMVVAGLFTHILPSQAIVDSYRNDFRTCAAQLLKSGVTANAASRACATALRPRELSGCVAQITKHTDINSMEALTACRRSRRQEDLSKCVVGISRSTQQAVNQATLNYCGRSLLPVTFAQCVVGLRKEIDLDPMVSLNTCKDANDFSVNLGAG
ncbi:MAG: hypothetical protein F6K61_15185 [Sphaerospermopsis sp. SIO1G1]|nr:hypothetical protein [Sphaerospermopsis sp. SIO1G1]